MPKPEIYDSIDDIPDPEEVVEDGNPTGEPDTEATPGDAPDESEGDEGGDTEPGDDSSEDVDEDGGDESEAPEDGGEEGGTFELKVDGEIVEKSREDMIRLAQKGLAADKRMQEASEGVKALKEAKLIQEESKKTEEAIAFFKDKLLSDPLEVVRELLLVQGYDEDQIFESVYSYTENTFARLLQEKEKPEERKLTAQEKRIQQLERQLEETNAEKQQRVEEEAAAQYQQELMAGIEKSLSDAKMPVDEDAVEEVVKVIIAADADEKELTPAEAVDILKDRLQEKRRKYAESLTIDDLESNKELIDQIRKKDLEAIKSRSNRAAGPTKKAAPTKRSRAKTKAKTYAEMYGDAMEE